MFNAGLFIYIVFFLFECVLFNFMFVIYFLQNKQNNNGCNIFNCFTIVYRKNSFIVPIVQMHKINNKTIQTWCQAYLEQETLNYRLYIRL